MCGETPPPVSPSRGGHRINPDRFGVQVITAGDFIEATSRRDAVNLVIRTALFP